MRVCIVQEPAYAYNLFTKTVQAGHVDLALWLAKECGANVWWRAVSPYYVYLKMFDTVCG